MDGEDGVGSGTVTIEFMFCNGFVVFSLKENLLGIFFVICLSSGKSLDQHVPFLILLNDQLIFVVFVKQVNQSFIVELEVGNGNLYVMLISGVYFLIKRRKKPGNNTPVLVV